MSLDLQQYRPGRASRSSFVLLALPIALAVGAAVLAVSENPSAGQRGPRLAQNAGAHLPASPASASASIGDPWDLVAGPTGWNAVDLGNARIWVPANWSVIGASTVRCGRGQGLVQVGAIHELASCPSAVSPEPTIVLTRLTGSVPSGHRTVVHGIGLVRLGRSGSRAVWDVPALGVQLTLSGPVPPRVLKSIGPSPQGTVLAPGPSLRAPQGWKLVSYRGVQARVPSRWPVVASIHAGACGLPFHSPTVYVGPDHSAVSCPAPLNPASQSSLGGLWLQPGNSVGRGGTWTRLPDGQRVQVITDQFTDAVVVLALHGVSAWVGVGADPAGARALVDSILVDAGAPNTAVADRCPAASSTMPTPARVVRTMTLDHGNDTLTPPLPADQPQVGAKTAWAAFVGTRGAVVGERTRLVLARYTGRFPAALQPDGATVPENDDVLAWVVLTTPVMTPAGPCGGWGLTAYNATTGAELIQSGYSPGP